MQMVRLGGRKQDALHPLSGQQPGQERVAPGPERAHRSSHGAAHILYRSRAAMDGAQHICQHNLPVDFGEMFAEERFDHLCLIRLKPPFHFTV